MPTPRLIISGLSGGAGKTLISLGLARSFSRRGLAVRTFKKGPDYIDAAWLSLAARTPQATLDPFFLAQHDLLALFTAEAAGHDLALVEGNRGLFDGLDLAGSCSTAELSRILQAPVLLVLDCTKMTRTAAALVKGCLEFEKDVRIGGVILNRTGNPRHRDMVRRAVEEHCGVPVLGVLPRQAEPFIVERRMGLAGPDEHAQADGLLDSLADVVSSHVDLRRILKLATSAPPLPLPHTPSGNERALSSAAIAPPRKAPCREPEQRIGYVLDAAFWHYYRENLSALEQAGARLVPLSLLSAAPWPEIDGLYIGGGMPELHAKALSDNAALRAHVAALAAAGLPIYAECGGFMYLTRAITVRGARFPMAGVFPCEAEFCSRPQGLGYVQAEVLGHNPFHPAGAHFRGHEFHFSRCTGLEKTEAQGQSAFMLRLHKGRGMTSGDDALGRDGLLHNNCFAGYTHIYAPALPHWAPAFLSLCRTRL